MRNYLVFILIFIFLAAVILYFNFMGSAVDLGPDASSCLQAEDKSSCVDCCLEFGIPFSLCNSGCSALPGDLTDDSECGNQHYQEDCEDCCFSKHCGEESECFVNLYNNCFENHCSDKPLIPDQGRCPFVIDPSHPAYIDHPFYNNQYLCCLWDNCFFDEDGNRKDKDEIVACTLCEELQLNEINPEELKP